MTVSAQTREQVLAVLERLQAAAGKGDPAGLATLADPDFSGFGPGGAARGPDGLSIVLPVPFRLAEVEIFAEGTIAWTLARMETDSVPGRAMRFTAVLRGTGHGWLVALVHASSPA
jgi:hypothetical protein